MSTTQILIVTGTGILVLALLLVLWRLGRRPLKHDGCPRCAYHVTELPGTTCPECGLDLDRAGIVEAGRRPPLAAWRKAAMLTVIVAALAALLVPPSRSKFDEFVPHLAAAKFDTRFAEPASGAYRQIVITCAMDRARFPAPLQYTVTLTDQDGRQHTLAYDDRTGAVKFVPPAEPGAAPEAPVVADDLEQALHRWVSGLGIDVEDERLQAELAIVSDAMQGTRMPQWSDRFGMWAFSPLRGGGADGLFGDDSSSVAVSDVPDPLRNPYVLYPLLAGPWLLLWAVGMLIIGWRAERRRRLLNCLTAASRAACEAVRCLLTGQHGRRRRAIALHSP